MASRQLGDQTLLEDRYASKTPQEIAQIFGADFARRCSQCQERSGKDRSARLWLASRQIDQRVPAQAPALADVREQIQRDWLFEQQQQANEAVYRQLRKRYDVVVADEAQRYFDLATGEARQGAAP